MMEFLRNEFHQALADSMTSLDGDNTIIIAGDKIMPSEALQDLRKTTYDLAFTEWLEDRKQQRIEFANDLLLNDSQKDRFAALQEIYRANSLTPFIGAGMSLPSGYKGWTKFLMQLQQETEIPEEDFLSLLNGGQYEEAAELLANDLSPREFAERIENAFGKTKEIQGPVQLLPHFFDSPIVTTNFDEVLERCFNSCEKRFDSILTGPDPKPYKRHSSQGKRILMKLHGTVDDERTRILTRSEYDSYYDGTNTLDFCIACLSNSPLLFLGCSLAQDRTLQALERIIQAPTAIDPARHYAFLPHPGTAKERERTRFLAKANIYPIWYECDEDDKEAHNDAIEALLFKLCTE